MPRWERPRGRFRRSQGLDVISHHTLHVIVPRVRMRGGCSGRCVCCVRQWRKGLCNKGITRLSREVHESIVYSCVYCSEISWERGKQEDNGERGKIGTRPEKTVGVIVCRRKTYEGSKFNYEGPFPDGVPRSSSASGVQVHEPRHSKNLRIHM